MPNSQIGSISISDYDYDLPNSLIAKYPLEQRDSSKLLIYDGQIADSNFASLSDNLPENSLIVRNNTRVVQARLIFLKDTGAQIEIFLIEPLVLDPLRSMQQTENCSWLCMVGNAKRWKSGALTIDLGNNTQLQALNIEQIEGEFEIRFNWSGKKTFAEVLELAGKTPLPPYLNRKAEEKDKLTYQTVYSKIEGSVAAPTAGLHFTQDVENSLKAKGCEFADLTLHVGAGTFKPVKSETIGQHGMHYEYFEVALETLLKIRQGIEDRRTVVCVGTTSMRALESLIWMGIKTPVAAELGQWDVYSEVQLGDPIQGLSQLINSIREKGESKFVGRTGIMIAPGYKFRICSGLITNFHQPKSTLLLLVSAFVGDVWKNIYGHALNNDYRFLSYGDSSLLWKQKI
ncbi:MAG: S-adenosylmethionine:tRNA ribosyltransferase-isomerase [Flavobacteriales bacterium]|nr:S-adenosylmethionine:tRNA ribosyltransferase-isomerase [Flavobacteriales bacterium]